MSYTVEVDKNNWTRQRIRNAFLNWHRLEETVWTFNYATANELTKGQYQHSKSFFYRLSKLSESQLNLVSYMYYYSLPSEKPTVKDAAKHFGIKESKIKSNLDTIYFVLRSPCLEPSYQLAAEK